MTSSFSAVLATATTTSTAATWWVTRTRQNLTDQGKAKQTRKFAAVKRMIKPSDPRL